MSAHQRETRYDAVAKEEPLEIRVGGESTAVTMRTPGNDFELVAGFLVTEGIIADGDGLRTMRYCVDGPQEYNVVDAALATGGGPPPSAMRRFFTTSSCGLCGKQSIDAVRSASPYDVAGDDVRVAATTVASLPDRLRAAQRGFAETGGLHAAGLFSASGDLLCVREDVGRHNAFDKVIGWAALDGRLPLRGHVILASGRASFELTQKALMAGIPVLTAVSAPSSLAVDLAEEVGMTLVGFVRDGAMNVYAGGERITGP